MYPRIAISQPRYLPAINYLQRIYHSDKFILLDDCQHQRRAFEHRNKIVRPRGSLQRVEQWLSLQIDKTEGSRPLIKDVKLISLRDTVFKHSHVVKDIYGIDSIPYQAFLQTCLDVARNEKIGDSLVSFTLSQILEIFSFLEISISTEIILSSSIPGTSSGSNRILECCLETGAKTYISGPNGRAYLSPVEFDRNYVQILYHDYSFPGYIQVGSGDFLPWMAWIDMLHAMGKQEVADIILSPPCLSVS